VTHQGLLLARLTPPRQGRTARVTNQSDSLEVVGLQGWVHSRAPSSAGRRSPVETWKRTGPPEPLSRFDDTAFTSLKPGDALLVVIGRQIDDEALVHVERKRSRLSWAPGSTEPCPVSVA
jgi:hypothetical protein